MFLEGHNPWLNFLHAHKGQGYDIEQLSQMYHQQYAQAGPKVYGGY
jgi:predicted transcriptional regulator